MIDILRPLTMLSIHAAVLAFVVALTLLVLGSRLSARWRFFLWSLVFVRLAIPVSLPAPFDLPWLESSASPPPPTRIREVPVIAATVPKGNVADDVVEATAPVAENAPVAEKAPVAKSAPVDVVAPVAMNPLPVAPAWTFLQVLQDHWPTMLVVGWILGAGSMLYRHARQHQKLMTLLQCCSPVSDARVLTLLEECRRQLGVRTKVTVLESDDLGPALTGVLSHTIVAPRQVWTTFSDEQLRLVFLHELSHLRRHDTLLQEFFALVSAVYWFHPLVWWVQRRLDCERELDCDAIVLQTVGRDRRLVYGQLLLTILGLSADTACRPAFLGTVGRLSNLKRRIAMIGKFTKLSWRSTLLGVVLLLVLATVGMTQVGSRRAPRAGTDAGQLIAKLDQLRTKRGNDEWADTLRQLIVLNKAAVPEIIAELDATEDEAMLRCMAFAARGIGDKRVIPALIRALPKACVPPGSDYGFVANDPALLGFMQSHQIQPTAGGTHYGFGRAVNEITATLQKLTGVQQRDDEIRHIHLAGNAQQKQMQRKLFHDCAERWATWWEKNWKDHVQDEKFARVDLPAQTTAEPTLPGGAIVFHTTNIVVESVFSPKAKNIFYDLDTGRTSKLPELLRGGKDQRERLDEILAWAATEGYDLMGTEVAGADGKKHYVLRGLGMTAWQLATERWQTIDVEIKNGERLKLGRPSGGLLCRYDSEKATYSYEEPATFAFRTREGSRGVLFVGVEVHDDGLQAGGAVGVNDELSPIAFQKGRRLAYKLIEDAK